MVVVKSEFYLALNQVATERGISPDDVLDSIKTAVMAAYKKDYGMGLAEDEQDEEESNMDVKIDKDTGEMRIFLKDKDVTPPGFGRIAAQTARQVILQKIREAEKKTIIQHYTSQVGTIIKGRVIRFDGKNAYLDIGKTEGTLPPEEQIRGESYKLNDSFIVYIKDIKKDDYGNSRIIVSRVDPGLVEKLFEKEVPEISTGTVKVFKVVREPGERAKIAVSSTQSGVDPVGACVGQKGIRVKAVTDQLGGEEKIDIIQYNPDDSLFIREALSPATVGNVEIIEENKKTKVTVDQNQAPLAIGKNGVNVNLASRLTGYEIDIVQVERDSEKVAKPEGEKEEEKASAREEESKQEVVVEEKEKEVKEEKKATNPAGEKSAEEIVDPLKTN